MFRRPDRILLRVPALAPAVKFYRALGLEFVRQDARLACLRFAEGDVELVLHTDDDLPADGVYYLVTDVRALYGRRVELGITFTSPPAPATRGYRATIRDPFGNPLAIVDRTLEAAAAPAVVEDGRPAGGLFPGVKVAAKVDRRRLIEAYTQIGRTADDLPYTPDFERLYHACTAHLPEPRPDRREVWRVLLTLRKAGKLPRLGEARSRPPDVTAEERAWWLRELGADIGRRDRLPYSPGFEQLADRFNRSRARPLSPHLLWRLVATLAK
jgi:predicted enzyme related to lactoylglutathione lyase